MVSLRRALLLLTCISAWTPFGARAFDPGDYIFRPSEASTALSSRSVHTIFQDSGGFLWLLTPQGLNRYSGYEVVRYTASGTANSLSHPHVTGIAEDSAGHFWLATLGGLNRLDAASGRFSQIAAADPISEDRPLSDAIRSLFRASDGTLWLGYYDAAGLSRFDPATRRFEHIYPASGGAQIRVSSFAEYPEGTLWAAVDGLGLIRIDGSSGSTALIPVQTIGYRAKTPRITHLMADSRGALWLSTAGEGLFRYNVDRASFDRYVHAAQDPTSLAADTVYMTTEDRAGNVWAATSQGISVFAEAAASFEHLDADSLSQRYPGVQSLLQGDSGIMWVGGFSGLVMGTRNLFTRIDRSSAGLPGESVNTFSQTADGRIWIGTDAGVDYLQTTPGGGNDLVPAYPTRPGAQAVMSLLGENDVLWAGTRNSGLVRVDLATGQRTLHSMRTADPSSIGANGVTSILRTSGGQLLVGTYGGGLSVLDEASGAFHTYRYEIDDAASISSDNVLALLEDSLGNILVGTDNGLNLFDARAGSFISFKREADNENSLSSNMAWSLHEDGNGDVWVATRGGGLNRWARDARASLTNRFETFGRDLNLPASDVYAVSSDSRGRLWFSHKLGLSRLDPVSRQVDTFDASDGLQGLKFNPAAVLKDSRGNIYFGDSRGFNIIESGTDIERAITPPLVMTDCRILNDPCDFGKPYHRLEQIELTHKDLIATFTVALLDYANPFSTTYRYRLEGIDNDWIELGTRRTVSLTSLPGGSYVLHVQGAGSDGVWNEDGISIPIKVLPPPWLSRWAISLYVVVFLSVIYYQYRKRNRAG